MEGLYETIRPHLYDALFPSRSLIRPEYEIFCIAATVLMVLLAIFIAALLRSCLGTFGNPCDVVLNSVALFVLFASGVVLSIVLARALAIYLYQLGRWDWK